jgi:hypothetical protein
MKRKKNYILIDSRDRDMNVYKEPDSYVIKLNDVIKNVFLVKLVYALYPKHGTEFYTNLHIEEFSPNAVSNNQYLVESFTQLPMINYYNEYRSELSDKVGKHFEQPIPKLSKLTIKFIGYDGRPTVMGDHFLKFEIEYYVFDGPPELTKITNNRVLNKDTTTTDNLFNLSEPYTKKDLNRAYRRLRDNVHTDEDRKKLKTEYLKCYENISDP